LNAACGLMVVMGTRIDATTIAAAVKRDKGWEFLLRAPYQ